MIKRLIIPVVFSFVFLSAPLYPDGDTVNNIFFDGPVLKTLHFDIRYPQGMEGLALTAGRLSEEAYIYIANSISHELSDVYTIILYPARISYYDSCVNDLVMAEESCLFSGRLNNRVAVPFTGSVRRLKNVLTHQLAHAFQHNILISGAGRIRALSVSNRAPFWMLEGMALYLSEGYDETADMAVVDLIAHEKFADIGDLTGGNAGGCQINKQGQSFFLYLESTYGRGLMGDLLRDLSDLRNFEESVAALTGKSIIEINKEWKGFFRKKYYRRMKDNIYDAEGRVATFQYANGSATTAYPAVSPDGIMIAYLEARGIHLSLVIAPLKMLKAGDKKRPLEKAIRVSIRGKIRLGIGGVHLMKNYLSWSGDGRMIACVAESGGSQTIYVVNAARGEIVHEIKLPFRAILDPAISPNGNILLFSGAAESATDIYLYYIQEKKIVRITDDPFDDRYPRMTFDDEDVIYSSNWNKEDDPERHDFNIFRHNLRNGNRDMIINGSGNDMHPDMSADGKKIIYISDKGGKYDAYVYLIPIGRSVRVSDFVTGVFFPRWFPDGKKISFIAYHDLSYDICVKRAGAD